MHGHPGSGLAVGQVELGTQDGVEVAGPEGDEPGRPVTFPALDHRAGLEAGRR